MQILDDLLTTVDNLLDVPSDALQRSQQSTGGPQK